MWWLDIGAACGGVITDKDGIIIDSCPYFRFLRGKHIEQVKVRAKEIIA